MSIFEGIGVAAAAIAASALVVVVVILVFAWFATRDEYAEEVERFSDYDGPAPRTWDHHRPRDKALDREADAAKRIQAKRAQEQADWRRMNPHAPPPWFERECE